MKPIGIHTVLSFIVGGCISASLYLTGVIDERERQAEALQEEVSDEESEET